MVARTTTREIATAATINACKEFDIDLVQITKHYPTCELCAPLQGKVFSLSGKDKRYPKYDGVLVKIPKHPNCRHVLVPYVRELDPDADETQRYSNTSLTEDPRSEKEKQDYKEMRDKVTIQTTRRRAREILLSENVSLEEKIKAAEKLKKSYDSTGQIPRGIDASILKQYDDFIKAQNNGIINAEKIIQEAKNGGRHSGKYKDASNWTK
jgi:Phage minor capsid protein 2.